MKVSASRASGLRAAAAIVIALTAVGCALRVALAGDALFADELSTYWIVTAHGLGGVVSTVHTNAEITPPLSFVASWLTTRAGGAPALLRAPALIAGTASIPLTYALGLRTVGHVAALVAAALTAAAPFMVYYSTEARAYGVMMALVLVSSLAMLRAADIHRTRWWVVYAVASCAAVYTHYTCVFVLAFQLAWLLWIRPQARRPALIANAAAAVAFLPWIAGLVNDFTSPTSRILSALSPFTLRDVRVALEHWSVGYPYATLPLRRLPGIPALVLLALAVVLAVAGLAYGARRPQARTRLDPRVALVIGMALATPVGEAIVSAVGTNLFGVRNMAASWPGFALTLAALLVAAGPRLRVVTTGLAIAAFAIAAVKLLDPQYRRPDYRAAAAFVDREAASGDVVLDATGVLSPGPPTPMDAALTRPYPIVRAGAPAERDHPYGFGDPIVPLSDAVRQAVATADGRRVFLVASTPPTTPTQRRRALRASANLFPPGYRVVARRNYPSFLGDVTVRVYAGQGG